MGINRLWYRFISTTGFPILVRWHLCIESAVVRSSYLHNGIPYTAKRASVSWISPRLFQNFYSPNWSHPCRVGIERDKNRIRSFNSTESVSNMLVYRGHQNRLCADPKPTAPKPALCLLQTRLCSDPKPTAPKPALCLLQNQLCAVPKPAAPKPALPVPTLKLPHQNRLCIGTKPAFSFWINISTAWEVRCDCQGLGLVARIEASILVFDTKQVLYWPVLGQIQFCSFDRRCKTCLDTKPVLYQGRFCTLTYVGDKHGWWKYVGQRIKCIEWMLSNSFTLSC